MTTPTTAPARVHMPHIHLPPATGILAVAVLVVLAVCYAAHRQRARRRAQLEASALGVFHGFLKVPVELNRHTFGRTPVQWDGRQLARISVRFAPGHRHTLLDFAPKLELALAHVFGGPVRVTVNAPKRTITAERRQPPAPLPAHADHPVTKPDPDLIPFATAANSQTVAWRLQSSSPHCLIVGETGKGKSVCLTTVVVEACRRSISTIVIDPKRVSLLRLKTFPGVERYAVTVADMAKALADVADLVDRRYGWIEGGVLPKNLPPLLVVVDEYVTLVERLRAAWRDQGGTGEAPAVRHFAAIARTGREARVHVCLATQRPDTEWVAGETRDQLGCRILLGQAKDGTRRMVEIGGTPSLDLPGRAMVLVAGREIECQIWQTAQLDRLQPAASPPPVLSQVQASKGATSHATGNPKTGATPAATDGTTRVQPPTPDEIVAQIHQLTDDGLSQRAIAERLGVSTATVVKYRQRQRPALHVVKDG